VERLRNQLADKTLYMKSVLFFGSGKWKDLGGCWPRLKIKGRCSKKSIKQLNRVSIWVRVSIRVRVAFRVSIRLSAI